MEEIGVDLHGYEPRAGSDSKKTLYDQTWENSYLKLKKYNEQYGDCNAPYRFTEDPLLGEWVSNQRKRLKLNGKDQDDYRVEKLNEMGFEWARKPEKSKLRNRSWNRTKNKEKVKKKVSALVWLLFGMIQLQKKIKSNKGLLLQLRK